MTLDGVRAHQQALQDIADANFGIRTSGTAGYDASVDYVVETLQAAGYEVTRQPFTFNAFIELTPPVLDVIAPIAISYVPGVDIGIFDQSDAGDVTADVVAVDLDLGLGNTSTSGCEAADFAGFPVGAIALLQRGACNFSVKAENAAAAGAVGAIIFNQGNTEDRQGLISGTLGNEYSGGIPVLEATYAVGETLAGLPGATVNLAANVFRGEATTENVLAELPGRNDDNVVMVGAHLDSVNEGPGHQRQRLGLCRNSRGRRADGQGQAAQHGALRLVGRRGIRPRRVGLLRPRVLTDEERDRIALYLNFDMIGSPNYVRFIYDGDGSAFGLEGPEGSAAIEKFFEDFYADRGLAFEPTEISFRSDYAGFFDSGIPFGGLFTGAEGIKTPEEAAIYGGTAGDQYDPCYHVACDTYDNVSLEVLDLNSDAVAASVLQYAMNTQAVNGKKGKGNFKPIERMMIGSHMAK